MLLEATRLRQILEQEGKRGFTDTAVFGGLDKLLANWFSQNTGAGSVQAACLRALYPPGFSYAALTPAARQQWAQSVIDALENPTQAPPVKTPLASKPPPVPEPAAKPAAPPKPQKEVKARAIAPVATDLAASTLSVKGISTILAGKFARLGVKSLRDLLYYFPRRHLDYSHLQTISQLREGNDQTVAANVWETRIIMPGGRRSTEAVLGDETGNMRAVWFNNPWVARELKTGDRIVLSGRVKFFQGRPVFESPEWETMEDRELIHTGRLVPLYPLTSGLHQRTVRRLLKEVVDGYAGALPEFLPGDILKRRHFLKLPEAVAEYHFPDSFDLKERARKRLAFDELFLLQLGVLARKRRWQASQPGVPFTVDKALLDKLIAALPFKLTKAQTRVVGEVMADLARPVAMARLLQGEVGSGKTVVALLALLMAVANGYQGALMAPTEILAEQHFKSIRRLLGGLGKGKEEGDYLYRVKGVLPRSLTLALLIGDVKESAKREIAELIAQGEVDIVLGTHALIQKGVGFKKLGLVVVDEQHRFGVEQRSALRQKGFNPHMLVMTATPIPRTLALTLYGDLDLSVIDELPPGRQAIKTKWLQPAQRESAYKFLRKEIAASHQAFIICPLVEESETIAAKAAVAEFERLTREVFPDLRLALLHGRMSAPEKEEVMSAFNRREADILVSTPVVEVGIDIPNATVMLIESADRFGLSQLHQFRGRVGRGEAQSYCMLLAENPSDVALLRLDIIEGTQDGFKLADEDLKLRGPGEFFGTRQSGIPDLKMARLSDVAILEMAREEAQGLFARDPDLKEKEHKPLLAELKRLFPTKKSGEWS